MDELIYYNKEIIKQNKMRLYELEYNNCKRKILKDIRKEIRISDYQVALRKRLYDYYNLTECLYHVIGKLRADGFQIRFISPNNIYTIIPRDILMNDEDIKKKQEKIRFLSFLNRQTNENILRKQYSKK
jgi:hypothetical protein